MRDPDTGSSKGFGFISYDNFDSSDAAIAAMNGTLLFTFLKSLPLIKCASFNSSLYKKHEFIKELTSNH